MSVFNSLRDGNRLRAGLVVGAITAAALVIAVVAGGIQIGQFETTPTAAQTEDDTPPPPALPTALGNPIGLAASVGSAAGSVDLTWTAAANAELHLVYLVAADGSGGRYWPRLSGSSSDVTITNLIGGQRYFFIVIAGRESSTNAGSYQWSEWSNWKAETAPRLGGLPNPPALPETEAREYSRYAEFEGSVVSVDRADKSFRLRITESEYLSLSSLPDIVTVDLSSFRSVPSWLIAGRNVEVEGRYYSASQTMRAHEIELEDDDDDDEDDDD